MGRFNLLHVFVWLQYLASVFSAKSSCPVHVKLTWTLPTKESNFGWLLVIGCTFDVPHLVLTVNVIEDFEIIYKSRDYRALSSGNE
jgi:hypothetical protein